MSDKERPCRECGIDFTPRGAESTKYCRTCAEARKRSAEEKNRRTKKRTVKRPIIRGWDKKRRPGLEPTCVACGKEFEKSGEVAVDHIVPAAVVAELNKSRLSGDPLNFLSKQYDAEDKRNLASACRSCHGKKRRAEIKLERGDMVGFLAVVRQIGYPEERVKKALALYGLSR